MVHSLRIALQVESNSNFDNYILSNDVVRGEPFSLHMHVENIGDHPFPGGRLTNSRIDFSGDRGPVASIEHSFEVIEPGQSAAVEHTFTALEAGNAWVYIKIDPQDEQSIDYYTPEGNMPVDERARTGPFYVVNRELLLLIEALKTP